MLRESGALISLQPNATKIVTEWGLDPLLHRVAEPQADRSFRIFNTEGNLVREIPLDASMFGAERMLYHRQDLHSALRAAATTEDGKGPAVVIRTDAEVTSCKPEEGIVILRSGESMNADLIVGADGIRSCTRTAVVGKESIAQPTGLSAYRMLIPTEKLSSLDLPKGILHMHDPAATTMVVGQDKRVIMGPGRGGKVLGIVALVPDENLHEDSTRDSWTWPGSKDKLMAAYSDFPQWLCAIFDQALDEEIGLWQLRDIDPLPTWTKGRTLLVGDAAHAMLPTQGQGASQAIEDAEALQAYLAGFGSGPVERSQVVEALNKVFNARYERASLIQAYSREQARPGAAGKKSVTLDPAAFMKYNCAYHGAIEWAGRVKDQDANGGNIEVLDKLGALKLVDAR